MKSSKNSRRFEPLAALAATAVLGAAALAWFCSQGYLLYYGDAQAHLNIARRLADTRSPGYEQIGTVWLPLPHVVMSWFARNDSWWRSGLAGGIPTVAVFATAGAFLFASVRRLFSSSAAGWAALLAFALNPNVLYLASIPMTEAYSFASVFGAIYFAVVACQTRSGWAAVAAGLVLTLGTMVRYDAWFLIPFFCLYLLAATRSVALTALFGTAASVGPLYWLAHNAIFFADPLEFYRGEWSAKAIYLRSVAAGTRYEGEHNWSKTWLYWNTAVQLTIGTPLILAGLAGILPALWKKAAGPMLIFAALPFFYLNSMYSGITPIHVPFWPNSYYNTRYALEALPFLALGAAGLVACLPGRLQVPAVALAGLLTTAPWLFHPHLENVITWKESAVNSAVRRSWTQAAAAYLRENYRGGGIAAGFGDLTGIFPQAGINLRETLHEGDGPYWQGAVSRPGLLLHEEWVVSLAGDALDRALKRPSQEDVPYDRVKIFVTEGPARLSIYRRRAHLSNRIANDLTHPRPIH